MTPAKMATDLESLVENRVFAFKNGIATSHWPHEYQFIFLLIIINTIII